ncbi:LacI family DNA-binding transcriptional regulator [Psychromonas ossibalaenae]|uniref:LacI family DNA-binding transcriptional regulator n=1 Tax=Psychromonas ossibalaenae TaxID=444922 RepID=UPI000477D4A9|nr:LacI family DNA-binding transcriptional regulator [Psychromonas ossibalaenae]
MTKVKKVTLKSIAKDLGVTHTTVSNAYNRPEKLSVSLKKRIFEYAESVNFHGPDNIGRSLRTGKSGSIGVIFNDSLSYVFTDQHDLQLMAGIASQCEKATVNIVLIPLKNEQESKSNALNALVDGYILNATHNQDMVIKKAIAKGVPIVTTDFVTEQHSSVSIDNFKAMQTVCEHLLSKGHRQFGIISFPSQQNSCGLSTLNKPVSGDNDVMMTRFSGCLESFSQADISLENCCLYEIDHDEEHGRLAAEAILKHNPDITALVCFSDRFAYGAAEYCLAQGMKIPQDIAITGFDDITVVQPVIPLTTVSQNPKQKGEVAIQLLLDHKSVVHHDLDFELIVREST